MCDCAPTRAKSGRAWHAAGGLIVAVLIRFVTVPAAAMRQESLVGNGCLRPVRSPARRSDDR